MSPRYERKPKSELRDWSTYATVGEWFDDYHGYVPIQMAAGLSRLMRTHIELTFPEAYATLLHAGTIIELQPDDRRRGKDSGAPFLTGSEPKASS